MKHATAASRAIANHVQGAVAAELASLFPETVVNANSSSSSDSQYHHLPSPRDVPLIFDTGASTTMKPHTRFHRTVRHTTTAVTMANGDSTRSTGVGEAMFPVVGHGIQLQSLVVPGLRDGLIAAGQVAKQHDILIQKRHMFVVPRGLPPATKLIHARGTKVRGVYQLDVAQPHTVHAVYRIPARDQVLHRTFNHAGADALRLMNRAHPTTRATLDKRLATLKPTNDWTGCHEGRATRAPFQTRARGESVESPALKPLDVIVTDTIGPIKPSVAPRKAYLQIAQDRATNLLAFIPFAARTEIPAALRNLIASWQLTRGTITKRLHTDNAKEQISAAIRTYLHAQGTSTTTTSPHSFAQNGAAERAIRTVITHVRCNILAAGLPETLWPYAALDAFKKLNATPRRAPNNPSLRPISPHELFYGIQPPTKHFLPFGQRGYVVHTGPKTNLAPRSTLASFLQAPNEHQYIILLMNGNISACRPSEFTPVHIAAAHQAISAQSAPPNSLASALRLPDGVLWAAAYDSDLNRQIWSVAI
jgi:hypothetical protein